MDSDKLEAFFSLKPNEKLCCVIEDEKVILHTNFVIDVYQIGLFCGKFNLKLISSKHYIFEDYINMTSKENIKYVFE